MELEPIFVVAIIFGFSYSVIYLIIRRKERMALLEKGVDASVWLTPRRQGSIALKYGLLFIGVALGIFVGSLLSALTTLNEEAAYFSMIFLFAGLGLVISHFLEKKEIKEEREIFKLEK